MVLSATAMASFRYGPFAEDAVHHVDVLLHIGIDGQRARRAATRYRSRPWLPTMRSLTFWAMPCP